MITTGYICDVCQAQKGLTNHWFSADPVGKSGNILVFRFDDSAMIHLCGENCVQKWVSQQLQKLKETNV